MKKINDVFIATPKDGSLEETISKLPGDIEDYSVVFTNADIKFIEKVVRSINGSDEGAQPSMLIPLSFIFSMPPFESTGALLETQDDKCVLGRIIDDFLENSTEWLYANRQLLLDLCGVCSDAVSKSVSIEQILAGQTKITPDIERVYLELALNRQDSFKRMKVLAAIHARLTYDDLVLAMAKGDVQATATIMFLFARSMAQYASNRAVEDGLERQDSRRRGGEKPVDRAGLLKLIQKYHNQFPNDTDKELWLRIKADLVSKKMMRPCKGYSVRFEFEPTDDSDIGGRLIQKKSKGKEHPMGFEAFRNARSEVRK
ncbi:hypothetical protein [Oceanidesulfovibrio marinus]|uniref:Uncharacterized protein n=1 Tax=Oceanidesulfovibrio marinus TaxID=370038 RepID=A0ABX6NFX1_9BACT|nr:hypothetical protein [Oceanidesulfovibrio marinus]QJT09512.1 hypothetical protein E8L03_11435 [Oceanidesulfovibrio marinus]